MLQAQGDLPAARQHLERSLAIKAKVFGTEDHPSVATSLHSLAGVLQAQGDLPAAVAKFRRVLEIEVKCYETRDHYVSAQTEVALAMLLLQADERAEALELLTHAAHIFEAQAPNHPLAVQLRQMFSASAPQPLDAGRVARLALAARSGVVLESADQQVLDAGLEALSRAGPPVDTVAVFLRTLAAGDELPPIPADLRPDLHEFLTQVRAAADALELPP